MHTLRRLIVLLWPHRSRLLLASGGALATCAGVLLFPLAVQALLGGLINSHEWRIAPWAWLALGVGTVLLAASCYLALLLFFTVAQRVAATLRGRYLEHLLAVPLGLQRQQQGGDLLERLAVSIADIEFFLRYNLIDLITISALLAGGLVMMFWLSWPLAVVVLTLAAAAALILVPVSRRLRQADQAGATAAGTLLALVQELLLGVDVVQAFNAQRHELARFGDQQARLQTVQRRAARYAALLEPLVVALAAVAFVVLLVCGGRWLATGQLTVERLVVFLVYVAIAASQGRPLSLQFLRWHQLATAVRRLDEPLRLPREADPPGAQPLPARVRGTIDLEAVSYHYPNREGAVVDLSCHIAAGECVGIVGESGAGKTTVFNLLLRFATPQRGVLRVDGRDLQTVTAASLRDAIAVVPQDSYLFNRTVLENVRWGRPAATDAEVRAACRSAQADAFIATLPQGDATMVGERGLQLSTGQRQRLAIARALLKDAPILLLDEATAALDAATERDLQAAMATLVQGRTTLIIAHRLATVVHLPRLLVLHRGRLIAEGSHQALLARCRVYANLVATQLVNAP